MTVIPGTNKQQTRQIQIPIFKGEQSAIEATTGATIPLVPEEELGIEYSPTVGYGLELLSIQMPIMLAITMTGTEAERKAAQFTVFAALGLYRRGQLLWEGGASLVSIPLAPGFGSKQLWGQFASQFTNPFIVPAPSELELKGRVTALGFNSETGGVVTFKVEVVNPKILAAYIKQFITPGTINYCMVKM